MRENATAEKTSAAAFFKYWQTIAVRSHSATVDWLFGDVRRAILQLLLFLGATVVLLRVGHRAEATEQAYWFLASAEAAVLMYCAIFLSYCFYLPATLAREQAALIDELNQQTGYSFVPTFQIWIERVPENDADRSLFDTEILFRVAVKNTHVRTGIDAYVKLEEMPEELGISPAARLIPIGQNPESGTFRIAPTETVYVPLLERHQVKDAAPLLVFSADTANLGNGMLQAANRLSRQYSRIGELLPGKTYSGVVVAYGTDALTRRLRFSVTINAVGEPTISSL